MGLRYIEEEGRRRKWLVLLLLLLLFGWLGFRSYTYLYLEGGLESWNEYMNNATRPAAAGDICQPSYSGVWEVGGRIAPISDQSWPLKQEICIVGCFERFNVTSTLLKVNVTGETNCHCDMKDCNPQPLPDWY